MRRTATWAAGLALLAGAASMSGAARTYHVSPDGDDAAAGTVETPFATLERAREAIRELRKAGPLPDGGVVVELRGGRYERDKAFELTAADSGTAEAPIVYRARAGEEVRIVGGKAVKDWRPVTDAKGLERLAPEARGKVLAADLKAQGIAGYGSLSRRGFGESVRVAHMELFFDDRPMTLARWPNEGYARMADLPEGQKARVFQYDGDRPARWAAEPDVWVYGYWYHDWADTYMKVERIDPKRRTITTRAPAHRYGLRKGNRWLAINALRELDSPGEYYVDRAAGVLYFWPPKDIASAPAVVSIAERLVTMKGTSHVTLRGMVLEACRGTAVTIDGGAGCRIVACTIRDIGNRAVQAVGREHAVVGCDIYETGDGGIGLSGGDRATLAPGGLRAENNHIHHFSRWSHTYRPAVGVGGCGQVVRHNLIHHAPHSGIQLGGNDHLIELNEIHSVCTDTGDVGAFYMGRDWTARGTVIRHNYFHHVAGPGRIGAMGVYLDDQASGIGIFGNVFQHVTRAVFIGGGCDNVVENNVFVDCVPAVHIDARGLGWQKAATDDPKATLRTGLAAMPYRNELWSKRYPDLPGILDDDPGTPKRNRIARNLCAGGKWDDIHAGTRKYQTVERNLVEQDGALAGIEKGALRLPPEGRLREIGFEPIPFERIGPYRSEDRASWPVTSEPIELAAVQPAPAPAPTGPTPVYAVPRSTAPGKIDGQIDPGEQVGSGLVLAEDFEGNKSPRTSRVWLHRAGDALYVAFDNAVPASPPLKREPKWGANDACEIAVRLAGGGKPGPILVLRGYADPAMTFESVEEAGASEAAAARAAQGVRYASKVVSPTRWTAEWLLPLASLGIDPSRPGRLQCNLSVRKTAGNLWLQWRSTRGNTHAVDRAGVLQWP